MAAEGSRCSKCSPKCSQHSEGCQSAAARQKKPAKKIERYISASVDEEEFSVCKFASPKINFIYLHHVFMSPGPTAIM